MDFRAHGIIANALAGTGKGNAYADQVIAALKAFDLIITTRKPLPRIAELEALVRQMARQLETEEQK